MISKELLNKLGYGKVLKEPEQIEYLDMDCLSFWCETTKPSGRKNYIISIHEIANKCKEWARSNKNILTSCPYEIYNQYSGNKDDLDYCTCYVNISEHENGIDYDYITEGETEPQAIFEACEFILKESKKNG